jgi:hypothetical protein
MEEAGHKKNVFKKIKALPFTQRVFLFVASVLGWFTLLYFLIGRNENLNARSTRNYGLLTLLFIAITSAVFFRSRKKPRP